jgi:RimJ/RimL family protein N-acetyltransferase
MNAYFAVPIITDRLIIRPYTEDDSLAYWKMCLRNKEHLTKYESENPVMSVESHEDAKGLMQDFAKEWEKSRHSFIGSFLRKTGEFACQVYVGWNPEQPLEFHIGYFVDEKHAGNGYVTESVKAIVAVLFEKTGATRIKSECDDSNLRSIAVLERCGFEIVEHIQSHREWPDGTMTGTLKFSYSENGSRE